MSYISGNDAKANALSFKDIKKSVVMNLINNDILESLPTGLFMVELDFKKYGISTLHDDLFLEIKAELADPLLGYVVEEMRTAVSTITSNGVSNTHTYRKLRLTYK